MSDKEAYSEVIQVGDVSFVFFPSDGGGRLISAKHIKTIVPDFKGPGSMVFLTESDKAVKVQQTPEEITNDLIEESETTETK